MNLYRRPGFSRASMRAGAIVDTTPASALLGVIMALACPTLVRNGYEVTAWVVGVALGIGIVLLLTHRWWVGQFAEWRSRGSQPPPAQPPPAQPPPTP